MSTKITLPAFSPDTISGAKPKMLQVVFLTADWCGTCVILEHIMNKLKVSYEPEVHFYKADYDRMKDWAQQYGIFAPPALIYAWDREIIEKDEGAVSGQEVVRKLDALMTQYQN